MKAIVLVLGSGGARGLCYIGVLKALEEFHIPIRRIVGTSMGAIIGAAYCTGMTLEEIEKRITKFHILKVLRYSPRSTALFSNKQLVHFIEKLVPQKSFESLSIPLSVICTDLEQGTSLVYESGALIPPVTGSAIIAGVFDPIEYDGHYLIDGGYLNPLPLDIADKHGKKIIAIDPSLPTGYSIRKYLQHGWKNMLNPRNLLQQALKGSDMTYAMLAKVQWTNFDHIRINVGFIDMSFIDFSNYRYAINLGYEETIKRIPEIEQYLLT
ncbi:MAG TPA: patatin-like phospholipase family protein [Bacteroidota bacterium]|nr:patatin-like phospholipase family protein [Bacteroidota bacterium]